MKIKIPSSLITPVSIGGALDPEIQALATYAILSGTPAGTSGAGVTTYDLNPANVPLPHATLMGVCQLIVSKGGDVEGSPFYLVIPDLDAELPAVMEPLDIDNGDETTHVETWRELSERWNSGLVADSEGNAHWSLMIARQPELDRPALTLAQAMSAGLTISAVGPVVED
jgi:hypothetical protein